MYINGLSGDITINLFKTDENKREINVHVLKSVRPIGDSLFYPNILFIKYNSTPKLIINPLDEKIMSLEKTTKKTTFSDDKILNLSEIKHHESNPVFFFVYNTENYFHFIYDTLPYLISYFEVKKDNPKLKLLMNFPNKNNEFYKFVSELLLIIGIKHEDILIIDNNTTYETVFISDSYTHGIDSNLPPRAELKTLYKNIVNKVKNNTDYPKNIYVSRRSWVHGDMSNIGTNYTTRRKLVNEDELVLLLKKHDFVEVFTENMSMVDKINLFANAENIIGPIGGGLVNSVFSKKDCNLISIMSPEFINVNKRFIFSINGVNLKTFEDTKHTEKTDFKLYMRVEVDNIVGEIIDITGNKCKISYSDTSVSGWNSESKYKQKECYLSDCIKLDNGLNSSWEINLTKFKEKYL